MVLVDGAGPPLGAYLEATSSAEVTRPEQTLHIVAVGRPGTPGRPRKRPKRLIADRGDDSNPRRARLAHRGIEPIIPARCNHTHATHQDGRKLRRSRRRWIVERTVAWLGHVRRLIVRYERLITTKARPRASSLSCPGATRGEISREVGLFWKKLGTRERLG
jgi:transposase